MKQIDIRLEITLVKSDDSSVLRFAACAKLPETDDIFGHHISSDIHKAAGVAVSNALAELALRGVK